MVASRGGIDSLGKLARHALNWSGSASHDILPAPLIRHSCRRVDCSFATATTGKPLFIQQGPWTIPPSPVPNGLVEYVGSSISLQLQGVLSQLRELTRILASSYSRLVTPEQMWNFSHQRTLVEQGLLLMRFSPDHISDYGKDSPLGAVAEVIRLGAQIYVNLVLRCILPLSSVHKTLSAQIGRAISTINAAVHGGPRLERLQILLWCAILGGTVSTDPVVREQLGSVVVKLCGQLGFSSWSECRYVMESVVYSHQGCGDLCEEFYVEAASCE